MRLPTAVLLCVLEACAASPTSRQRYQPGSTAPTSASEPERSVEPEPRSPEVSPSRPQVVELPVPGFEPALVVLPTSAAPAPIVIATHGAGGNAEWQCDHWSAIIRGRALLLCPRGRRISLRSNHGYYYPNHLELEREVLAMVAAARHEFAASIRSGPGIYTGFSQGATMGALMLPAHGDEFAYLLLVEGATSEFSAARARHFQRSGGKSVAFVCGGRFCAKGAENMARILRRAGVSARAEYVPHGGHTDDGAVGERAEQVFESMLAELLAAPP